MKSFASHRRFLERKAHAPWKAHAAFAIMKSIASPRRFVERKAHAPWKAHAAFAIMKPIASLRRRLFRSLFFYKGGRILTLSIIVGG
jgi:hypothetical protein